jgi:transcriptional regulator with XRE-family HTH domain
MQRIDFDIFRNNLRTLRQVHNFTAKDLSIKAEMKQQKRVSDIEEGKGSPSLDEIYTLSLIFNTSIDRLLFQELRITVQ